MRDSPDFNQLFQGFALELDFHNRDTPGRLSIEHALPAKPEQLDEFERSWGTKIPDEIRSYYLTANGTRFGSGDFEVLPIQNVQEQEGLLLIQDWGNGDFTAAIARPELFTEQDWAESGTICFMNHRPSDVAFVQTGLAWLIVATKQEYFTSGKVHHPGDYCLEGVDTPSNGVFRGVAKQLIGQDTEMNRTYGR